MTLSDLYDRQIEAILKDDYAEFFRLIGTPGRETAPVNWSHYQVWNRTGMNTDSLFAELPGCRVCASQIEYHRFEPGHPGEAVREKVLAGTPLSLPNLLVDYDYDDASWIAEVEAVRFTREQLAEFKRRQLVARVGGEAADLFQ